MSACLKTFCNNGIHSGILAFSGEKTARHDVRHLDTCLMQTGGELLGTACRCEYNLHSLVDDDIHQSVDLGIHQRNIYTPWL